ncbi:MAG: hypothetical protein ACM31O_03770 [Bacteroidota bacterium]
MTTSPEIKALLRRRYTHPAWALCFEVANSTGGPAQRYADAVAMSLYPSRGLALLGFEIKISRSDFLREIKDPDKSVAVQQYCDQWWLVAHEAVVDETLLPPAWGWLQVHNGTLRVRKKAPQLAPKPIDRGFMAAMVRRAHEIDQDEVKAAVAMELARLREDDERRIEREVRARTREAESALKQLAELKARIGVDNWDYLESSDVALAVKIVRASGLTRTYGGLRELQQSLAAHARAIEDALAKLGVEPGDLAEPPSLAAHVRAMQGAAQ